MTSGCHSRDVVVIIGAGGMGLAVARRLAFEKHVLLADFQETTLYQALSTLQKDGISAEAHKVDIADYPSVEALAQAAQSAGHISVIVHTAGLSPAAASARDIYAVDLLGTANIIEAFSYVACKGTSLTCIASMAGHFISFSPDLERHLATAPLSRLLDHEELDLESENCNLAYTVSKRANILRVQGAAKAWGDRYARLNSISPGVIATPLLISQLDSPLGASPKALVEVSALKRMGTPDEIASVAAFLAGPESMYITGTDIIVDGGTVSARKWSK
ncbi:hypothetical protein N0V90_011243 [Kalmusia sp. IMI 367209]|nr:hypothetical protein N0V90_011243 [Kalmusia sp. IMI 367209]